MGNTHMTSKQSSLTIAMNGNYDNENNPQLMTREQLFMVYTRNYTEATRLRAQIRDQRGSLSKEQLKTLQARYERAHRNARTLQKKADRMGWSTSLKEYVSNSLRVLGVSVKPIDSIRRDVSTSMDSLRKAYMGNSSEEEAETEITKEQEPPAQTSRPVFAHRPSPLGEGTQTLATSIATIAAKAAQHRPIRPNLSPPGLMGEAISVLDLAAPLLIQAAGTYLATRASAGNSLFGPTTREHGQDHRDFYFRHTS